MNRPPRRRAGGRIGSRLAKPSGRRLSTVAGLLLLMSVSAAQGGVEARLVQAGFLAESGPSYRPGVWCPLRVELTLRGASSFSGVLRVAQLDADADVCLSEAPVALSGEGTSRTYWLYAVPNPLARAVRSDHPFQVSLIDESGAAVPFKGPGGAVATRLAARQPMVALDDSEILLLDISAQPLSRLGMALRDVGESGSLRHPVLLARCRPEHVATAWFGLEMADYIVWDGADPSAMEYSQVEALIEWVRRGGHLVLAASRTAGVVSQSSLGPLLPVEIGATQTHTLMPQVQREMLAMNGEQEWPGGLVVAQTRLRPGARARITEKRSPFLSIARVGHGSVTFVAAELRDLWRLEPEILPGPDGEAPGGEERILRSRALLDSLFAFRQTSVRGLQRGIPEETYLFDHVKGTVDFRARSGAFMGVALLFVVAYLLTATVVSWHWLKQRNWQHLNWTVFAVVVLAASLLSLGAVRVVRGITTELHQLSVVDLTTESYQATATCYFGLKTATHTNLDLWLPSDPGLPESEQPGLCSLKPMPPVSRRSPGGFLSPQSYRARPVRARLEGVPFRATLKQFVGHWAGEMSGRFSGRLHLSSGAILDPSWIENGLGVDLAGCYLLVARIDPSMERTAGYIYVYDLGTVEEGRRIERLGSYLRDLAKEKTGARKAEEPETTPTLKDLQTEWADDLRPSLVPGLGGPREREIDPENYDKALLLLTTLKEYEPEIGGAGFGDPSLLATQGRRLDRSDLLSGNAVMLVGFADEGGPARLATRLSRKKRGRFEPVAPSEARTMYRVLIPVTR